MDHVGDRLCVLSERFDVQHTGYIYAAMAEENAHPGGTRGVYFLFLFRFLFFGQARGKPLCLGSRAASLGHRIGDIVDAGGATADIDALTQRMQR